MCPDRRTKATPNSTSTRWWERNNNNDENDDDDADDDDDDGDDDDDDDLLALKAGFNLLGRASWQARFIYFCSPIYELLNKFPQNLCGF